MNGTQPSISVVVLTYNSAQFVTDTLESIARQTLQDFEIIVADDCSSDDTVSICEEWLNHHPNIKSRTQIIVPEKNTGTAGNCNRGIRASVGKWIKLIAGDDILLENCLHDNLQFCTDSNAEICFSKMQLVNMDGQPMQDDPEYAAMLERFFEKSKAEKRAVYYRNPIFLNVPTEFFSRKLFDTVNGFDERIPLLEDQPFFFRVLDAGFDLYFMEKYTVKYRRHEGSVINNNNFRGDVLKAFELYRKEELNKTVTGKLIAGLEQSILNDRKNKNTSGFAHRVKSKLHYELTKI